MIKIFDTTLRDGEQAPGYSMNRSEKTEFAKQLEALGVDIIEAGFPNSSDEDFESVKEIARVIQNSCVCGLARLVKADIDRSWEAIKDAKHPRIHAFIATSDIHLEHKLNMTREQVLDKTTELVGYARSLCEDVEFSAEDATRSDWDYLAKVCERAIEAGATTINLPDTVGYTTPNEMFDMVKYIREHVKGVENVCLSMHCHNDLGMAVANTLAGVMAGCTQIECAVNGIGERAGNVALEEVVMAMHTRKNYFDAETRINMKQIYRASKLLSTLTGVQINPSKPVVGANAFAHEAGIHQHGVIKSRLTYEIMNPETIGMYQNKFVLGKHSGKHAFAERLSTMGYTLTPQEIEKAFVDFKKVAEKKKYINDRDIEALVVTERGKDSQVYVLENFTVQLGSSSLASAGIRLLKDGALVEDAAIGSGPIDAAFKAIERIANTEAELINYSIQAVTEGEDALGEAVVKLMTKEGETVTGRGLSTDIIESSIKAYISGVNKIVSIKKMRKGE